MIWPHHGYFWPPFHKLSILAGRASARHRTLSPQFHRDRVFSLEVFNCKFGFPVYINKPTLILPSRASASGVLKF